MYRIIILTLLPFLFSCGNRLDKQKIHYVCNCNEKKIASDFVKSSIKDANNMSDEEMEDVIKELTKASIRLSCHQEKIWYNCEGIIIQEKLQLDSCSTLVDFF